jgi:YesN/AraC family two-component response regulator
MEQERIHSACRNFLCATNVGVTAIDPTGVVIAQTKQTCGHCSFCGSVLNETARNDCALWGLYGSNQAERFGGRYIFFCHLGFTHFASPVYLNGKREFSLLAGPILMIERDEFFSDEVLPKHPLKDNQYDQARQMLDQIPYFVTEEVHAFSELLFMTAEHLGEKNLQQYERHERQRLQGEISDYIMRVKGNELPGFYPIEKEEKLLCAVSQGNSTAAKALLNEVIGSILYYASYQFDVVRLRFLELIVLLSRATLKGGADVEHILALNSVSIPEIDNCKTIEDLTYWLTLTLNRFMDNVFNFSDVKHSDIIYSAISYMKTHYMDKITLEVVADQVCLSPPYFSKVFNEEVRCTFNHYLNRIRIEQSKRFLMNKHIPLGDVYSLAGYEDQSYFSKIFKRLTGIAPLRYRQSHAI